LIQINAQDARQFTPSNGNKRRERRWRYWGTERRKRLEGNEDALMRKLSIYVLTALACGLPVTVLAIEGPQLPSSAKKLTSKEIVDLQDGVTMTFEAYTFDAPVTGTVVHNFQNNQHTGKYTMGGVETAFHGPIWIKDDMLCHVGPRGDICGFVYVDGSSFYNVSPERKVQSVDTKQ
jgi:hypothetical protein